MSATRLMRRRVSTRAFLQRPVSMDLVRSILSAAGQAPSGTNIQPWQVHVVADTARASMSAAVRSAAASSDARSDGGYDYYPREWRDPYLARRRACGWGLYGLLGIRKGDREAGLAQELRNYDFFDAPIGLFIFIDRDLGRGSMLDCGMFLQNLMLAALEAGLATCPQAAWVPFDRTVRAQLGVPDTQMLVCGIALGYADPDAPVNSYRPGRLAVDEFTTWHSDPNGAAAP
jgi:nitroreductase